MDDSDVDTYIVSRLGDPWKFLFVDIDIALIGGFVFMAFFMGHLTMTGVLASAAVGYVLHVSRQNKPKGYLRHQLYWLMPHSMSFLKRTPPSYCTEMLG